MCCYVSIFLKPLFLLCAHLQVFVTGTIFIFFSIIIFFHTDVRDQTTVHALQDTVG